MRLAILLAVAMLLPARARADGCGLSQGSCSEYFAYGAVAMVDIGFTGYDALLLKNELKPSPVIGALELAAAAPQAAFCWSRVHATSRGSVATALAAMWATLLTAHGAYLLVFTAPPRDDHYIDRGPGLSLAPTALPSEHETLPGLALSGRF